MKKHKTRIHFTVLYIIIFILLLNQNIILDDKKTIIKNMDENTQINYLNQSIETLNTSHSEYTNYIEASKKQMANTINLYSDKNVSENDDFDIFIANISNLTTLPENTYYYVEGTEGSNAIERYKYINGNYYSCNENGTVPEGTTATDVSSKTLIAYTSSTPGNLSPGTASYINKSLLLGDGSSSRKMTYVGNNSANNGRAPGSTTSLKYTIPENGDYIIVTNAHSGDNEQNATVTNSNLTSSNATSTVTLLNQTYNRSIYNTAYSSASRTSIYSITNAKAGDILTMTSVGQYSRGNQIIVFKY